MADASQESYIGTIINFGTDDGQKGDGFGFVQADGHAIADAYFNLPILLRTDFPIPEDTATLNGLRVQYTVRKMADGALRVANIGLIGTSNYILRSAWQEAAIEAGTLPDPQQHHGVIKWFDAKRGFGFITPNAGGNDVLVHTSNVPDRGSLQEGQKVSYQRTKNIFRDVDKGWKVHGILTLVETPELLLDKHILKVLAHAEIFKSATLEVISFNLQKGFGFLVERGMDRTDRSNHIHVTMPTLRTYPLPAVEEGIERDELLKDMVFWKNPTTGAMAVLPKGFAIMLPVAKPSITGTLTEFIPEKGYGYISRDDNERDVFFHVSSALGNAIKQGDKLAFDCAKNELRTKKSSLLEVTTLHSINGEAVKPQHVADTATRPIGERGDAICYSNPAKPDGCSKA